jgi:hypothetical protein
MKIHDIIVETTTSGAVATVAMPMGQVITRTPANLVQYKYNNKSRKRNKNARR